MSPDSPPIATEGPDKHQLDRAPQFSTSTTLKRNNLESLPDEVLMNIIGNGDAENTTSMARNLCLVSKRMEPVARQELYRAISILTCRSLRSLCRTLEKNPELGQYMRDLKLIVPTDELRSGNSFRTRTIENFALLWSFYYEVLVRSAGLRKLTMMVVDHGHHSDPTLSPHHGFIHRLLEAITRSQHSGSIIAILPQLEQVRLMSDVGWDRPTVHPEAFKPFLHLPSLSSLECMNDSGDWAKCKSSAQPAGSPANVINASHYEQIKSVVLRESGCNPTDIMDLTNIASDLEVLFIQYSLGTVLGSGQRAEAASATQKKAGQLEKRYLSDSLEKLQSLNTLAFIPHNNGFGLTNYITDFLGPSNFLDLKNLRNLTSISVPINVFASPDGSITDRLTVSPTKVLPRSLETLHIIVDANGGKDFLFSPPLNEAWFQPRVAALGFMEELASICPIVFPSLRQVEYIWAVTRLTEIQRRQEFVEYLWSTPEELRDLEDIRLCDGSVPLCCPMHTTIQALSPDIDYTSKAEGIVSPFRGRFDSLELAFKNVGVTFEVTELKEYGDFFLHWQQGRK
ncbi:hypothetical protein SLS63_012786 [Diaporthe eres]|uniref:F-box domain-containing protein n=1 Tax=Diaporthe eres TaxID=83184 RepID=A0ABR1NQC3_DIAER